MKIAVIGLGFVGLTVALGFADKGFDVAGYDIDEGRRASIRGGIVPFFEPGLGMALKDNLNVKFAISENAWGAAKNADVVFLCVGTPCEDDGKADLQYLFAAINSITGALSHECVFIIKSTVPPGTTANMVSPYLRGKAFNGAVVVNPEFLREGYCWKDFTAPDRIVCGCGERDIKAKELLAELYAPFNAPIHFVSQNTAEFIKYLSNSLLASLISFSNEMAFIAEAAGSVNVAKAFKILHQDKRLSDAGIKHYIYPGCGYGGYCLPKDTAALSMNSKQLGFTPRILDGVISLNNEMPLQTARKIERLAGSRVAKIGILGLSFKPNSDDVRDSSAAKIIDCLVRDGYINIFAYDPAAMKTFSEMYGFAINYCGTKEAVCDICDTIAVITIWPEFQGVNQKYPQKKWCDCRYWLED